MMSVQRFFMTLIGALLISLSISLQSHAELLQRININTATANELVQLKGIGPQKAWRIIEYRRKHGPFKNIHELVLVKGIGEKTVKKNAHRITTGP
ncbi:ComEA family DNA-binding protein [Hahella sp. SMD15-11]|uniref:ComEA family DNA-binding protein n=1 Tax=Thermohahella caldifontis TaxID=3142973 RepID=A0AB39UX18_9GAMM